MSPRIATSRRERGLVLVSSLLLLLVITIIALGLFRSFDVQERIAGNIREKQRATHAAESALQYAEWWLSSGANSSQPAVACSVLLNANLGEGQICSNTMATIAAKPADVPWAVSGAPVGVSYTPLAGVSSFGMNIQPTTPVVNSYAQAPVFYISYLGTCADGQGSCYQIDSVGYGGTASAVSVVQSTYEISSGVSNLGGP